MQTQQIASPNPTIKELDNGAGAAIVQPTTIQPTTVRKATPTKAKRKPRRRTRGA
ncbi:MAG TPA: hypothetical protein VGV59_20200 [Pyrinomonadaceae bacterium]|nr:hypothetical protein [Pyrinomonadaceae bacterium]